MDIANRLGGGPGSGDKFYSTRAAVDAAEREIEPLVRNAEHPEHGPEVRMHLDRLVKVGKRAQRAIDVAASLAPKAPAAPKPGRIA
jgi:hypothetical protein